MRKYMKLLFCSLLMLSLGFAFSVSAAETTVYVKDGGEGDGSSADAPFGSLSDAFVALGGEGGTITLVGDTTVSSTLTIPEQSGNLTLTAQNGAVLNVGARIQIEKNTNSNTFTFDVPFNMTSSAFMFGGFNSIVFTKNFTVSGEAFRFYGGVHTGEAETNEACITELAYSVEVNGGTFTHFAGGSLRNGTSQFLGSIAAPITVTINGGTFGVSGDYSAALAANKSFDAFNVSGMSILADKATLNITGGTFNTPIYISGRRGRIDEKATEKSTLTASDKKYYAIDGDIAVNISGGNFLGGAVCDFYTDTGYTQQLRGSYTVNVTGGTFAEGTVFDATQVKAYAGETKKAAITVKDGISVFAKRFDEVKGANVTKVTCEDEPLRIAFVGASITQGVNSSNQSTKSFPAQFLTLATEASKDVIISNLGVSGSGLLRSTSRYYYDMLAYPILKTEVDADYYVFHLGSNDAYAAGGAEGARIEHCENYRALAEFCGGKADAKRVYITSTTPWGSTSSADAKRKSIRLASVIVPEQKKIAEELIAKDPNKYFYVDLYAFANLSIEDIGLSAFMSSDCNHPSDTGYGVMAQCIYNAIYNKVYAPEDFFMEDIYVSDNGTQFGTGTEDSPISSLSVAMGKCADNATIHILDTISWNTNINTPKNRQSLTIVGEKDGAELKLTGTGNYYLTVGSPLTLDNITVSHEGGKALTIIGGYNDVTITENFSASCTLNFYAGYFVRTPLESETDTTALYDTVESASADADCKITISAGAFNTFLGGNYRNVAASPYGTYSGDMTVTIGENVTVSDGEGSGIAGMNYVTGTTAATVNGWGDAVIKDNAAAGDTEGFTFDLFKNTGLVKTTVSNSVTAEHIVTGDFTEDGNFTIGDVLAALKHLLNDKTGNADTHFYGVTELNLRHIIHLLKKAVK